MAATAELKIEKCANLQISNSIYFKMNGPNVFIFYSRIVCLKLFAVTEFYNFPNFMIAAKRC